MHCVRIDRPSDWLIANVYVLADLHIGDPHADNRIIARRVEQIARDPQALCIINGDLLNTALRNSVSDVYGEVATPMQQIDEACGLLLPIKDKIIGATTGNHEARAYRSDGIDMTRLVCRQLGVEDKYSPDGVLVFLRFGKKQAHGCGGGNAGAPQWYSIYATHGSGGGRKEGAKAIRLADMAAIVDADVYIHGHTHLPMVFKQAFYRVSTQQCSAQLVDKLFVNSGAALNYGGYGQAQEYKPSSLATPVIQLEAWHKIATATL